MGWRLYKYEKHFNKSLIVTKQGAVQEMRNTGQLLVFHSANTWSTLYNAKSISTCSPSASFANCAPK